MQFWYKLLFNLPENLRKRIQTAKNTINLSFFISLSTSDSRPRHKAKTPPPPQKNKQTNKQQQQQQQHQLSIGHANICGTLITSCNPGSKIFHFSIKKLFTAQSTKKCKVSLTVKQI